MTTRLYLKKMPSLGGADVEISAFTGRRGSPFFDHQQSLVEMGMRYGQGEASQGEWFLMDPEQDFVTTFGASMPDAHWLVTWTEDGPGAETWLSRGRVGTDEGGREGVIIDDELAFRVTVDDCNVDLRGQAFTESWVRPAETDIQRLVALQLYTLNGSSSTATYHRDTCNVTVNTSHLAPNANTVNMPAKKYLPGTQPDEVIRDCADTAGKMYGVVIHHTGGSHLCLLYITQDDHTTYLSPAKISDELTDWDPEDPSAPVWEPHWERGSGVILSMQTRLSGLVGIWGVENATFDEYPGVADATDYWVEAYHDGDSTTAGQAISRTAGILEERRNNHLTHRVSVIVQPDQVDLIAAGMSIPWKTAVDDPDQYLTRHIAELRWEPRHDGTYWAHMDLERPLLRVAPGRGKVGPIPPVQSEPGGGAVSDYLWTFTANNKDETNTYPMGTLGTNWHANYVHTHVINPGITSATPYPPITPGDYQVRARYGRMVGSPYNSGGVGIVVTSRDGGVGTTIGTFPLHGYYDGTEYTIDVTVPAGGDELSFNMPYNDSMISEIEVTHGSSTEAFVGTPSPPAASDPIGSIGTSPVGANADHMHAAQIADVTPIGDAGGYFEGGNVEEALQEAAPRLVPDGGTDGQVLTKQSGTDYDADWEAPGGMTADQIAAFGFVGEILISDTPSTPLVFADLLQNEAQDDLIYGP